MNQKSFGGIVLGKIIGILVFSIALTGANILQIYFPNSIFYAITNFFNQNFGLIILAAIIFLFAEIFFNLVLPFSFIAPPINAVASLVSIVLLMKLIRLLNELFWGSAGATVAILVVEIFICPLIFLVVMISGYVQIFAKEKKENGGSKADEDASKFGINGKKPGSKITWRDVAEELKMMLFEIFRAARTHLKRAKKHHQGKASGRKRQGKR